MWKENRKEVSLQEISYTHLLNSIKFLERKIFILETTEGGGVEPFYEKLHHLLEERDRRILALKKRLSAK